MLKLKADAQPADEPGKTRGTAVRIEGVSAPKNMKIGLVASSAGQDADADAAGGQARAAPAEAEPAKSASGKPQSAAGKPAAVKDAKPGKPALAPKQPAAGQKPAAAGRFAAARKAAKPAASSESRTSLPEPQPFAPAQAETSSALPKLGLAAAGLAAASAMLLFFQFGGGTAEEEAAAATPQAEAAETAPAGALLPAGAAQAAAQEPADASGEDALVARITAGTLAALRNKQAEPEAAALPPAAPAEGTALFKMVMAAAAQGQSEAYIDQLVNGAYERQEITVPASLIGADGRVDTATLLTLFVGN